MPSSVRTDESLALHIAALAQVQSDYAQTHAGRFWQGLRTHVTASPSEVLLLPLRDQISRPTNEQDGWGSFWPGLPRALPFSLQVDSYDGPQGTGYLVIAETMVGAEKWRRVVNVGPEVYREMPWHILQLSLLG